MKESISTSTDPALRHNFSKQEKLCRQSIINQLFSDKGTSRYGVYPLLFLYGSQSLPSPYPAQLLISVPKKKFKKAYKRHRIKRLISEGWRHHKHELYAAVKERKNQLAVIALYIAVEELSFKEIENAIITGIRKMAAEN